MATFKTKENDMVYSQPWCVRRESGMFQFLNGCYKPGNHCVRLSSFRVHYIHSVQKTSAVNGSQSLGKGAVILREQHGDGGWKDSCAINSA